MKENKQLEFKEKITNTFLKTVSAFANYEGGTIIFGIDDSGEIVGIDDMKQSSQDIENMINDSIKPNPSYTIETNGKQKTISVEVKPGNMQPYFYKHKAYKRNDTSTIEVDNRELRRLMLEGEHLNYEELDASEQNLTFTVLEKSLREQVGINRFDLDVLKTLKLYSNEHGYNKAAEILADENSCPGIDIAKFGDSISIIQKRITAERKSILIGFEKALELYRDYYQYEVVAGDKRSKVATIPEEAFREAVANAIIHREWDVNSNIRISLFEDRIEVVSPGGLPSGISSEEYVEGRFSVLRNPILSNVFNRLNIVETFGTGIRRIKESYIASVSQPEFDIKENSIQVTLPVTNNNQNLTADELAVYNSLSNAKAKPISEIMDSPLIEFGKSKTTEILKALGNRKIITIEGAGRGTKYRKANNMANIWQDKDGVLHIE